MATPFISEIKIISWNYPPKGWAFCNGQLMPINQNQALFALLGTSYGGNGQTTFGLPDFRGRVPVHVGSQLGINGQSGGEEFHTLQIPEMPAHTHVAQAQPANADTGIPNNNMLAGVPTFAYRTSLTNLTSLKPSCVTPAGGSQPHENRQPYLVLNFVIALVGVFPSRN
ncbi:MAG: phage tail protein [Acidobacteria bacterium]|nr:MAG: phage tail protein [Acidobacteriota bacterium]